MEAIGYEVAELKRRLDNVVRVGVVAEVDAAAGAVRVRWEGPPDAPALTRWVPWATTRAGARERDWRPPSAGEAVLLLSPGGELENAVAAVALFSAAAPANAAGATAATTTFEDGAEIHYDAAAHLLRFTAQDGAALRHDAAANALSAVLPAGGAATLAADGGVSITGDVSVDGAITATGDVSDAAGSMQEMRDTYNAHVHPAANPPGNTAAPTSRMD